MLEPTYMSKGIPSSSAARNTPRCAAPFAAPPDATKAILGLRSFIGESFSPAAVQPQSQPRMDGRNEKCVSFENITARERRQTSQGAEI
jgi:hypothetical protein